MASAVDAESLAKDVDVAEDGVTFVARFEVSYGACMGRMVRKMNASAFLEMSPVAVK